MTLVELLMILLDLAQHGPPSAIEIEARLAALATAREVAGPNLDHPDWAHSVNGGNDVYLSMAGDVAGVQAHEDSRGWGAYAEVAVRRGTLADVESIVGPLSEIARNPDDFSSGRRVAAYPWRNGWTVRVIAELAANDLDVRHVSLSYPSKSTPWRPEERPVVALPVPPAPPLVGPGAVVPPTIAPPPRPPSFPPPPSTFAPPAPPAPTPPPAVKGTCATCGVVNKPDDAFCGNCGSFLQW